MEGTLKTIVSISRETRPLAPYLHSETCELAYPRDKKYIVPSSPLRARADGRGFAAAEGQWRTRH